VLSTQYRGADEVLVDTAPGMIVIVSRLRVTFGPFSLTLRIGPLNASRRSGRIQVGRAPTSISRSPRSEPPPRRPVTLHPAGVAQFLRLRCDGSCETYRLEIRRTAAVSLSGRTSSPESIPEGRSSLASSEIVDLSSHAVCE